MNLVKTCICSVGVVNCVQTNLKNVSEFHRLRLYKQRAPYFGGICSRWETFEYRRLDSSSHLLQFSSKISKGTHLSCLRITNGHKFSLYRIYRLSDSRRRIDKCFDGSKGAIDECFDGPKGVILKWEFRTASRSYAWFIWSPRRQKNRAIQEISHWSCKGALTVQNIGVQSVLFYRFTTKNRWTRYPGNGCVVWSWFVGLSLNP